VYGYVTSLIAEKGRQVYTIRKTASVAEAVREMNTKGIGALLVVEEGRALGIFTERDVLRRVVDADRDPTAIKIAEVMTRNPVTIDCGAHVAEAMEIMTERRFRHLPVIEDGEIVAMLSIGDVLKWLTKHQEDEIRHMSEYIKGSA
jgi:CBS domain-containing protein